MHLAEARALATGIERLTLWLRRQAPQTVSSSTITALDRLATEGPLRISELAAREAMTQPGVSLLVQRMAEAGYVERVPDPTDRRATLVRITRVGKAVLVERLTQRSQVLRSRLSRLGEEEQRLLLAALPAIERLTEITDTADTMRTPVA